MISYCDLTKTQRKWVDLVELCYPEITNTVTFQQIKEIHENFVSRRLENKKFKVAKALWLVINNRVDRGLYKFPSSKLENVEPEVEVIDDELEVAYKAELAKVGIKPKKHK